MLVTHDAELAAFAARVVTLRDGLIISDQRQSARQATAAPSIRRRLTRARRPCPVTQRASAASPSTIPESDAAPLTFGTMALRAAARALARNKLRSILTMLGIFIGVAALIAMVAVGQGANEAVEEQIAAWAPIC